ncbi:MAG: protease modulator HflC [Chloroflexi bacterium]|nr:MAG: protease modulator HflC [Chloroflexota bacterium]HMN12839.1 protease modulator HflC [Bellilinea sp.]
MKRIRTLLLGLLALVLLATYLILFQVDATEAAIVTQFGQPIQVITQPGLYRKLPDPIQNVIRINRQLEVYNLPQTEFLTADKKNIVLEAYAVWQVTDPLAFLKTVRDPVGAETRLADIIAAELGAALGQVELGQLVTVDAQQLRLPEMLTTVTAGAAARTAAFGFQVTDVRLKQLTFPEANLTSVFQRMRAEREAIARQFRSEGTEQAAGIRAAADAERAQILADAEQQAAEIRGQADAEAIAIYAQAFGKDLEFYRFLRTLQSYESFIDENTTLILPSDSELLEYLNPANEHVAAAVVNPEAQP